ncbi:GGDEF domain-containing protein [Pseudomonas sp. S9]|uniref:GGDEF domain-containing protein n=1 Tax=Pseudomonas sp. S9 TaxID=686578 RepID=UPI0002F83B21|nr:GGDEF domain-containing protein [Pseudomonas sp. S9]
MKPAHWQAETQHLDKLRLFDKVALSNIEQLLKEFLAYDIDAGEILLSPTTRNQYLYVLVSGQLEVYLGSLENQPVSTLYVGDCAGEISFIDNDHPCAFVMASQPSRVLRLHRASLVNLFQHSPQLMQNLLELLCQRVRQGNRTILSSEQHANIDTLTGTFNRRWLEHVFEREATRCAFNEQPFSLLMLDVDHFKDYNDQHGHLAGDYALRMVAQTLTDQLRKKDSLVPYGRPQPPPPPPPPPILAPHPSNPYNDQHGHLAGHYALRMVAQTLTDQLRKKDSLVRYGGEEFVILLPEMGIDEALRIAERLRLSLQAVSIFYSPMGPLPGVTVSIGLSSNCSQDTLQSMLTRADSALYKAKQQGRNCLRH